MSAASKRFAAVDVRLGSWRSRDRVAGILDAHFTIVSNRLNQVMKLLTVMATIFLPLGVLTSLSGMNVPLPELPGGEGTQFWWVTGIVAAIALLMLALFRRVRWVRSRGVATLRL